jgi:drug/metabolite transporter (DMT)-like permease
MANHKLSLHQYFILGLVSICAPLGDACLKRGMSAMPTISLAHPMELIGAVFTPWIALGIVLLIGFFASYLTALSWADLTYVLPATASGYVVMEILAHFWLGEQVSWMRWLGALLITVGVAYVAQGPASTTPVAEEAPSKLEVG